MSRREQQRAETSAEIKQIARQQLGEVGASSISLRGIARQMGLSAPALYRYFPNYDALITELILDAYGSLADALITAEAAEARDDFGGRFMATLHGFRDWCLAHPQEYLLIDGSPIPNYEAPAELTSPAAQRSWRVLFSVLIEAHMAGALDLPDDFGRNLPNYDQYVAQWSEEIGVPLTVPLLHTAMAGTALLNGLLLAEVTNRFPGVAAETTLVEIELLRQRIGLPQPFDKTA